METSTNTQWLKHLPNKLTLGRIATAPVLLLLYPLDFYVLNIFCALIFALASITDFLDGYLARKHGSVSLLGSLLDPIADKMLIATALILLAYKHHVPALMAGLLICRDIGVSGLRLLALEQRINIEVSEFGKWKTFLQSIALFCLLIEDSLFNFPFRTVGMVTLWVSLFLSLYSAWLYWQAFWKKAKTSVIG